ncbi:hypothetical protein FEM48_Zijuj09G0200100 [Ziziphus jujuba var. spinosa]|uniref:Uncharacterized protein n=1 Tax=Ziziphus jujuba var. spinosa TaxID=714518 RepID=A0A978UV11_ZIZJJ|nr:hypothetical protein FEM48_Zijuj09G0200100 [Ziziphus jujuba var. spinosa]
MEIFEIKQHDDEDRVKGFTGTKGDCRDVKLRMVGQRKMVIEMDNKILRLVETRSISTVLEGYRRKRKSKPPPPPPPIKL